MANLNKLLIGILFILSMVLMGGCGGSGGHSTTHIYSSGYYDPYPNWGRRTIYVDHDHNHGNRPRPPGMRPPGSRPPGMGRPPQRPTKPKPRPRPTPRPAPRRRG